MHRATTLNRAECYAQGKPRSRTSSTHSASAVGAHTRSDDTVDKPAVSFDGEFDKGFICQVVKVQQGPLAITGVVSSTRNRRKHVSRNRCETDFRIVTTLFEGTGRSLRSRQTNACIVGSPKCLFGIGPQYHLSIEIAGGKRLLESPHHHRSIGAAGICFWVAGHLRFLRLLEHSVGDRWALGPESESL